MKNNSLLNKISNNKILLFLIPNLISFYSLFYFYNQNIKLIVAVLFYEVLIGCIIYLFINTILYFLLNKILKDKQKVFCIMCIISLFYSTKMSLLPFAGFITLILIITILFKYFINVSLDTIVGLITFIVIFLFSFTFITSVYNVSYITLKSKNYNYEKKFEVDEEKENPNIYWVHCDGMMNLNDVRKYFNSDLSYFNQYFIKNNYYYNEDAELAVGHSTLRSLAALFNPTYYDEFYKEYLIDLEKQYLEKKKNSKFIVNYYELEEKRLNNELFNALGEKGYKTVVIGDYSPYTAFCSDYFYDYYYYSDDGSGFHTDKKELRYINMEDNNKFQLNSYIRFNHARLLFYNTIIYPLIEDINYLDYDLIKYNDLELKDYDYTNKTEYWNAKAIFKSLKESYNENEKHFTFVDYKLAHYPLFFTQYGEQIGKENEYNINYYVGNYVYSFKLLLEMLDYIKTIDKNAIIVVQADHGLHVYEDWDLMQQLNINNEELQEVRNSVINAVYVPKKYRNGDEELLGNPLNISRYLVNNFVGYNYEYIK